MGSRMWLRRGVGMLQVAVGLVGGWEGWRGLVCDCGGVPYVAGKGGGSLLWWRDLVCGCGGGVGVLLVVRGVIGVLYLAGRGVEVL